MTIVDQFRETVNSFKRKRNFYIVDKEDNIDTGTHPAIFGEGGKYVKVPEVSCTI